MGLHLVSSKNTDYEHGLLLQRNHELRRELQGCLFYRLPPGLRSVQPHISMAPQHADINVVSGCSTSHRHLRGPWWQNRPWT